MLTAIHRQVRRHRSQVLALLAVMSLAAVGAAAHNALMSGDMTAGHVAGTTAGICLVVGAGVAMTGAAVLAARRILVRPTWSAVVLAVPVAPSPPALRTVAVRAGPPSVLQVFRF